MCMMTGLVGGDMTNVATWNRVVPGFSEDRLVLAEFEHRVANELSAALAALHLVRSAKGSKPRWQLLRAAIERLEGFAVVHRLLSTRKVSVVDVAEDLEELCTALAKSRPSADGSTLHLELPSTRIDGASARRLIMIASELVLNSIRYALEGTGRHLTVSLDSQGADVFLTVADDGPGIVPRSEASGGGMGTPIVAELVHRAGGRIMRRSGPDGTTIQVCLPTDPSSIGRARRDRG